MATKLLNIDATTDEMQFAAQSIKLGHDRIINECAMIDDSIARLTAQRLALQPSLDAATSLAAKIAAEFPPEVKPPIAEPDPDQEDDATAETLPIVEPFMPEYVPDYPTLDVTSDAKTKIK